MVSVFLAGRTNYGSQLEADFANNKYQNSGKKTEWL